MQYAGIIKNDFVSAPGVSTTFFTQGCPHRCPGCQNPSTWDFNGGIEFTNETSEECLDILDTYSGKEVFLDSRKFTYGYFKDGEEDLFRVSLYDTNINQEQIMLRNKQGVYVLTPSLNQAYNFKSGWPLNSAKPYIYQSLLEVFDVHKVK